MKIDYAAYVWGLWEKEIQSRSNSDYEPDKQQMDKLIAAYRLMNELAANGGGRVEPLRLVPKEVHCGITAYFTVFYATHENLLKICEVARSFSALSIDSLTDGTVCISFTIPNVFKRKSS